MSRSYSRRSICTFTQVVGPDWASIRQRERQCLDEAAYEKNDDVLFSQRLYPASPSEELHHWRWYLSKEKIRNQFVSEIHRILNWCGYRNGWNYHEKYLEVYHKIKKGLEPGHYSSYNLLKLCWLYTKEIRREIKAWKGDPFDLLYFLVHHGIIERAVSIKLKRLIQK